jgi:hypothetical protein
MTATMPKMTVDTASSSISSRGRKRFASNPKVGLHLNVGPEEGPTEKEAMGRRTPPTLEVFR